MLESLRLFANSWLAKIFLFIVLLCFTFVWGTPLYKSSIDDAVLSAGKVSTSGSEFIFQINKYLHDLSNAMGGKHNISIKEAQSTGALKYFNSQLNFNTLIDSLTYQLHLNLSDKKVAEILAKDNFFTNGSNFNTSYFKNYITQLGVMQGDAVRIYEKQGKRKQLIDSIASEQKLPQIFFDYVQKYFNEFYNIEYVTISKDNLLPIQTRSDEILKKWYNDNKKNYKTNEQRTVDIFTLSKDKLIKEQDIKEPDIKTYYDKNIAKYTQDETRDYDLLTFDNMIEAKKAQAKLDDAFKDNKKVTHHTKIKQSDAPEYLKTDLFKLGESKYTGVLKDKNKFYIAKVSKITPKSVKSLNDVHDDIKNIFAKENTEKYLNKTKQDIDAKLKTSTKFADIAKTYNLSVENHTIDKNGDIVSNTTHDNAIDKSSWDKLLRAAFHGEQGQKHIAIDIKDGGHVWYNISGITPSRQKTFEEVKKNITDIFLKKDEENALNKRAEELKKELDSKLTMQQLAEENNLTIKTINDINRFNTKADYTKILDENTITNIMSYKVNENIVSSTIDPNTRYIIKIAKIYNDSTRNKPLNKLTIKQMNDELKNDILFQIELAANKITPLIIHNGNISYILSRMR